MLPTKKGKTEVILGNSELNHETFVVNEIPILMFLVPVASFAPVNSLKAQMSLVSHTSPDYVPRMWYMYCISYTWS